MHGVGRSDEDGEDASRYRAHAVQYFALCVCVWLVGVSRCTVRGGPAPRVRCLSCTSNLGRYSYHVKLSCMTLVSGIVHSIPRLTLTERGLTLTRRTGRATRAGRARGARPRFFLKLLRLLFLYIRCDPSRGRVGWAPGHGTRHSRRHSPAERPAEPPTATPHSARGRDLTDVSVCVREVVCAFKTTGSRHTILKTSTTPPTISVLSTWRRARRAARETARRETRESNPLYPPFHLCAAARVSRRRIARRGLAMRPSLHQA